MEHAAWNHVQTGEQAMLDRHIDRRAFLRGTATVLSAAAAGSVVAACGSNDSDSGSKPFTYLSNDNDPESIKWYKQVNAAFEKETKLSISGQIIEPGQDFVTKLQSSVRADRAPTFIPHLDETLAATLYASKLAEPADALISSIGEKSFASTALGHHATRDGHYHSVPWTVNGMVLWYRNDLMEHAGLSKVTTWDELLKYAKANTKNGKYGICLPFGQSTGCTRLFFNFIVNNGGHFVDKDLNVVFDSPQNVETMAFLQELAHYSPPGSSTYEWGDMISKFTSEVCGASFYPGRMLGSVVEDAPKLESRLAADLVPSPSGSGRLSYVKSEGPVMLSAGADAGPAKKWILDYQFGKKWYTKFLVISGGNSVPQVKSMRTDPAFSKYPLYARHAAIMHTLEKAVAVGANYSREAADYPINSNGGTIDNGTLVVDILQDLLVHKTAPKAAARSGAAKLRDAMKGAKPI